LGLNLALGGLLAVQSLDPHEMKGEKGRRRQTHKRGHEFTGPFAVEETLFGPDDPGISSLGVPARAIDGEDESPCSAEREEVVSSATASPA
jgi:hypothetical protein